METEKKRRGRPSLSPEDKEQRRIANDIKRNKHHKETGYAAQKKYKRENHEIKVTIHKKYKEPLDELIVKTGLSSPAQLFLDAVEKLYGISLHDVDKK